MNHKDYSDWFDKIGFCAVFSYNQDDYSILENRKGFASSFQFDQNAIVIPKQVHSKNVCDVKSPGFLEETDGVISKRKEIVLSIQVADCIPLFLVDMTTDYWGLIHSGWQGTVKNISAEAIYQLQKTGSKSTDIKALIGPSINQCCFEVGAEVSEQFDSSFSVLGKGNRKMVDLKSVVRHQLIESGVPAGNIMIDDDCTYCRSDLYFSFRREGEKAGRMVAMSGWR
ncbi:MAG: peptidoglycan editing factor PgeF [Candidatus Marinimicrobia bacterium]|nr:peptidoglycan editing factor PgeF [Candidatus Neomarinimicrobiota bacterium]